MLQKSVKDCYSGGLKYGFKSLVSILAPIVTKANQKLKPQISKNLSLEFHFKGSGVGQAIEKLPQ